MSLTSLVRSRMACSTGEIDVVVEVEELKHTVEVEEVHIV